MSLIDIIQNPEQFWLSVEFRQQNQQIGLKLDETHKEYFLRLCQHLKQQYNDPQRHGRNQLKFFRNSQLDLTNLNNIKDRKVRMERFAPTADHLNFNLKDFVLSEKTKETDSIYHFRNQSVILEPEIEHDQKLIDLSFQFGQLLAPYVKDMCILFFQINETGRIETLAGQHQGHFQSEVYLVPKEAALDTSFYIYLFL